MVIKMNRDEAIAYLKRKGKLADPYKEREFSDEEEEKITKVEKEGKIYGDPVVEIMS